MIILGNDFRFVFDFKGRCILQKREDGKFVNAKEEDLPYFVAQVVSAAREIPNELEVHHD
jgi:hypothetical protein